MTSTWIQRPMTFAAACLCAGLFSNGSASAGSGFVSADRANFEVDTIGFYAVSMASVFDAGDLTVVDLYLPLIIEDVSSEDVLEVATGGETLTESPSEMWEFDGGQVFFPFGAPKHFVPGSDPFVVFDWESMEFWDGGEVIQYQGEDIQSVPLPGALVLMGSAIAVLLGFRRVRVGRRDQETA